jgi:hypothetical protein
MTVRAFRCFPENEFLRRVQKLKDAADKLTREDPDHHVWWPFTWSIDSKIESCFLRPDGLWQSKEKINTHCNDGGTYKIGIWRIEPNYNFNGQPCYDSNRVYGFFKKSETRKVLLTHDGYDYVWRWAEFLPPTETCWGLRQGPTFFEMCQGGSCLVRADTKAAFQREVRCYYKEVA